MALKRKQKALLKTLGIHTLIGLAVVLILPLLLTIAPEHEIQMLLTVSLLGINTIAALAGGIVFGLKHKFHWCYLAMVAILSLIYVMLFFLDLLGLVCVAAYVILAALGMLVAVQSDRLTQKTKRRVTRY